MSQFFCIVLLLLTCGALSAQNQEHRIRNIVLVHGAWADGSGWKGVYDILVKDGYNVSIVQEPETSFKDDVAATQARPRSTRWTMHSCRSQLRGSRNYGSGEWIHRLPAWCISRPTCQMPERMRRTMESASQATSAKSGAIKKTPDGFTYIDPAQFHEYVRSRPLRAIRPPSWPARRYSTSATISKPSSPPLRGEANQAGCW